MKKIISVLAVLALAGSMAFAQDKQEKKNGNDWREKVRAEQVAFITSELDLSESEAQAFWPVYNEVQKLRREAFRATQEGRRKDGGRCGGPLQEGSSGEQGGQAPSGRRKIPPEPDSPPGPGTGSRTGRRPRQRKAFPRKPSASGERAVYHVAAPVTELGQTRVMGNDDDGLA